jgi:oxalate decarboxylase/phosphoglucose isomerase-like protein (cupin superfamily)
MKTSLKKFKGKKFKLKVKDAKKKGKNIYKNIKGFENKINYILTDLDPKKSGLKRLMVTHHIIYPGKVNKEFKMTRGHKHNAEEVYIFLKGKGKIVIGKKKVDVKEGDVVTVPVNNWHRTINTGKRKFVYLAVFEKSRHQHLKK